MTTDETRAENISRQVNRLVAWMELNKPDNKVIRLYVKDFQFLRKEQLVTRTKGFHNQDDHVVYRGFTLISY